MTEQTSRLSIVVDTTNAQQRLAQFRQSLRQATTNANQAGQGLQALQQNTNELAISTERLNGIYRDCAGRLHHANGRFISLAEAMRQTGLSAEQLHRHFDRVGNSANTAGNAVNRFSSPLTRVNNLLSHAQAIISGGMFGLFALSVAKTADTMQDLNSQIMLVTKNEQEQLVVTERLHKMANKNLTDLKSTIGLYTNSARALGNMGKSQEEVLKFTNAVSLAMGVGGKSAQEQASALLQLGQAMQSGVLQGDEFRSLAENAPIMLDLIAEKLGKTRGEVRKIAGEGEITAEVVYDSLSGATDKLQAMFDKMPVTMSQAFGVVKNNYNVFVDNFINKTTGLSGAVAKGLIGISNHFETIAKVAIAGAGVALVGLAGKVTLTTTAFTALKAVMIAHPVLAIATAVLGVSSAFFGLNDVLDTTGTVFMDFFGLVKTGLGGLLDLANAVAFNIANNFKHSNEQSSQGFALFFANTEKGFTGFLQGVGRVVASATATLAGFFKWIGNGVYQVGRVFANLVIGIGNLIKTVVNNISSAIQNVLNSAIDKINGVIESVNSVLAHTPLEVQIKTIARISNFATDYQQSQYLGISGDTLMNNIASYMPYTVGLSDNYFGTVANRQNPQKATADLTQALNNNTQAVSDNTKGEKEKGKKGKGDKKGQNSDKPLLKDNVAKAILWGANELGINPNYLASVISFETGGTFSTNARNPKSSGTGLIQFMDYVDGKSDGRYYGMTRNQFGALSHMEQMPYVVKYFREKGLKKGASLGDVYDAVTGYGYKKGTKAYNLNKVWDTNQNGIIEKGESVKSGAFKAHIKNFFGKNVDLQDLGNAQMDMAKIAEKQEKELEQLQKTQADILNNYLGEYSKFKSKLAEEVAKIQKAGFDPQTTADLIGRAEEKINAELSRWRYAQAEETFNAKIHEYGELEKLDFAYAKKRNDILTDEKFLYGLNAEQKQAMLDAVDSAYQYDLAKYQLNLAEKTAGLFDYQKTELQLINEKYDLEAQKIRLNGESKALQDLQLAHNQGLRHNEILKATDTARHNYTDVMANLYGFGQQYQGEKQALDTWQSQFEAVKTAMDMGIIQQEEYYKILADIDNQYLANKQAIMVGSYQQIFSTLGGLARAFGGEQSKVYQVMANIEKGYALYKTFLANKTAIATAWASAPFPYNIPAVAKATLETGLLQSAIESFTPKGFKTGGYTGNVGINDVAGVVHGQEYVLNANATKRIGVDNLNRLNRGENIGGGQTVIINVTVNSDGTANVDSQDQMGKQMGEAIKIAVQQELRRERMQGGALYGR